MAAARRAQLTRQPHRRTRLSSGSALGFDFGLRRIGVASGDTLTKSAAPLAAVMCSASGPDWPAIDHLLDAYKPAVLVVGYPYNEDGTPGALAGAADQFAAALARRAAMAVARVDERGSTQEAAAELKGRRAAGTRRHRVERGDVDSLAAAIILERWLRGEY
ncbi:MAG TPA: Holliday junction resolvase RuvX [Steroidobacteraceae bacterium]|nr:Holliday junction resolvase RuvX [Steroidobacteraceae bacterium]